MNVTCQQCGAVFDDAIRNTICPHPEIKSSAHRLQHEMAMGLIGKQIRFHHLPPGSGVRCYGVTFEGMVSIEGLPGEFAPHLFVVDEEPRAVDDSWNYKCECGETYSRINHTVCPSCFTWPRVDLVMGPPPDATQRVRIKADPDEKGGE